MKIEGKGQITVLIDRANEGDEGARAELIDLIYNEFRRMARNIIRAKGRVERDYKTTDLVHSMYEKVFNKCGQKWKNRSYLFGAVNKAMRRLLVDLAREMNAIKRGGGRKRVSIDEQHMVVVEVAIAKEIAVTRALERLYKKDRIGAKGIELHYYWGLTWGEIAKKLDIPVSTLENKRRLAIAKLRVELKDWNPEET